MIEETAGADSSISDRMQAVEKAINCLSSNLHDFAVETNRVAVGSAEAICYLLEEVRSLKARYQHLSDRIDQLEEADVVTRQELRIAIETLREQL